jgi:hypothetical protein
MVDLPSLYRMGSSSIPLYPNDYHFAVRLRSLRKTGDRIGLPKDLNGYVHLAMTLG